MTNTRTFLTSYIHMNSMTHCHHRGNYFCLQAGAKCFIKKVVGGLLVLCTLISIGYFLPLMIINMFTIFNMNQNFPLTTQIAQNDFPIKQKLPLFRKLARRPPSKYAENEVRLQRDSNNINWKNDYNIPQKEKTWTRISDEVFVYSAHLDMRNFSTSTPRLNNLSWTPTTTEGEGVVNASKESGQRITHADDDDDDSDKLKHVILVRIVGIKAIPSLREFIKKDILDWFRIKGEMGYSEKYLCKLFFGSSVTKNLQSITSNKVTYTVIEEGVKIYASCYFNCYFSMNSSVFQMVKSTAFTSNLQVSMYPVGVDDYPTKLIEVGTRMIIPRKGYESGNNISFRKNSLAICVRPLFGPFDDLEKLIQFISFYHLMGITRFNLYAMSISPRVRKYLLKLIEQMDKEATKDEMRELPRIILYNWNVPTGNVSELWDYGTLASLNDCLFSNIDQEFVVFVDVDEFIVPQNGRVPKSSILDDSHDYIDDAHTTSLWTVIDSYNRSKTFQYLIRNTFFCHEFCEKNKNDSSNSNMNLLNQLTKTPKSEMTPIIPASFTETDSLDEYLRSMPIFRCSVRTKRVWNSALRSKYIVNPREVLAVGHHIVTKYVTKVDFRFSGNSVQVDPNIAILNHYRECASISSRKHPILTRVRETDKTMLMFRRKLIEYLFKFYVPKLE